MISLTRFAAWSPPFPPPILFPHNLLKQEPELSFGILSSTMAALQKPITSPLCTVAGAIVGWDQDAAQEHPTPRPPSENESDSSHSPSKRARRRSAPYRGFSPATTQFTPSHRRHESMPNTTLKRSDPRSATVYKWLDDIEQAGGVQPLDNLPFQPPYDIKHPSDSIKPHPSPQIRVDVTHWETVVEEEEPETPTEIMDSQVLNLGITVSGDTPMADAWPDMHVDNFSSGETLTKNMNVKGPAV